MQGLLCRCPAYKHIKEEYATLYTNSTTSQQVMEKAGRHFGQILLKFQK